MKVLLVEDDKVLRIAMEQALTIAGYEVISAGDGDGALHLAREHCPALILLLPTTMKRMFFSAGQQPELG